MIQKERIFIAQCMEDRMKLGKVLDINKCFYDKDHWNHPDLKVRQLYIVCRGPKSKKESWMIGTFFFADVHCFFTSNGAGERYRFGFYDERVNPYQEGWKHIQEVII